MVGRLYREFPANISPARSDLIVIKDELSDDMIFDCAYSQQSTYAEHRQFAYSLPSHYSSIAANQLTFMVSLSAPHHEVLFVTIVNRHSEPIVFYDDSRRLVDRRV